MTDEEREMGRAVAQVIGQALAAHAGAMRYVCEAVGADLLAARASVARYLAPVVEAQRLARAQAASAVRATHVLAAVGEFAARRLETQRAIAALYATPPPPHVAVRHVHTITVVEEVPGVM
jgi:hypothetical protein